MTEAASSAISALSTVSAKQAELLDKTIALVSTKDPLAYQAVQAMNGYTTQYHEPYDPSDEAEIERMKSLGIDEENQDGDSPFDPERERDYLASFGVPVDGL